MIVVDTNVIASAVIRRPDSAAARKALALDTDWRVPPLWRSGFLSVLRFEVVECGLTLAQAEAAFAYALTQFEHREAFPGPGTVLRLVSKRVKSYDAEFLALAETLGSRVVTNDVDFARASRRRAVLFADYLDESLPGTLLGTRSSPAKRGRRVRARHRLAAARRAAGRSSVACATR